MLKVLFILLVLISGTFFINTSFAVVPSINIGSLGIDNGEFNEPRGMFVDSDGNVYVADTRNDRIQKFDANGVFVEIVDFGNTSLSDPSDVFVDLSGNVYVADTRNNRVVVADSSGTVTTIGDGRGINAGQLDEPRGMFVDSDGNVYVADTRNDRIQKFDANGVFVLELGEFGIKEGQFSDPSDVFVDSEGNVYVADTKNNRIQKFDAGNTDDKTTIFVVDINLNQNNPLSTVSFDVIDPFESIIPIDNITNIAVSIDDGIVNIVNNVGAANLPEYALTDENQIPGTTWSVPATIIPLNSLDNAKIAVISVNELATNQELHMSINNNEKLANGGIVKGVQFTPKDTINNLKIGATTTEKPPATIPEINNSVMYLTFDVQGQVSINQVNLDSTEQFSEAPSISFQLGPIDGSFHPTHPTSVKNGLIMCPNINLGLADSLGQIDFSGISVFRDTNGDTNDVCGYNAALEHFSTYAVIPASSEVGGGSGDKTPPSLRTQTYDKGEVPLTINNMQFSELNYSNIVETQEIKTGEEFSVKLLIDDGARGTETEFVGLFMNLNGHYRQLHHSDTYITYDTEKGLESFDPNRFFSNVELEQKQKGEKIEMDFNIVFDREMPTSDIIIRMWDTNKNSQDTILYDVIKITETDIVTEKKGIKEKNQEPTDEFIDTIEKWAGHQSESITDEEFVNYLGIEMNHNTKPIIPDWFKTNFSEWIISNTLTEEDMKEALTWMNVKNII